MGDVTVAMPILSVVSLLALYYLFATSDQLQNKLKRAIKLFCDKRHYHQGKEL